MNDKKGMIIVLSGFSGAGKGTIMKHLLKKYPDDYHLSISATTRPMRPTEEDGREYFFKTVQEFSEMMQNHMLLEYASFNGNYYGTPRDYVEKLLDEGKDVILEIEVNGALQIKDIYKDAILLFVTPPSANELKDRLIGRATESEKVIAQRLAISSKESYLMDRYDYLIINDKLEDAVEQVNCIIRAKHLLTENNKNKILDMQDQLKAFAEGE